MHSSALSLGTSNGRATTKDVPMGLTGLAGTFKTLSASGRSPQTYSGSTEASWILLPSFFRGRSVVRVEADGTRHAVVSGFRSFGFV